MAFVNEHQQTEVVVTVQQYDAVRLTTEQTILALDGDIFDGGSGVGISTDQ